MSKQFVSIIAVISFVLGSVIGIGVYVGTSEKTQASTVTPCPQQSTATTSPAPTPTRSKADTRNDLIVSAGSQRMQMLDELRNIKRNPAKNLDEFGQSTRLAYKLADSIGRQITEIEVHQLARHEIGYTTKELRELKREALMQTLTMIGHVAKRGGVNTCLWEGGCLTKEEIGETQRRVREEIAEL